MLKSNTTTHTHSGGDSSAYKDQAGEGAARLHARAFAEKLDVSVSYLAELERGRTGISVKMLVKVCDLLGLSADYVLFGENRSADALLLDKIHRIDDRYMPLLNKIIIELLALSRKELQNEK